MFFVRCCRTLKSRYNASLDEARLSIACRDLVSCVCLQGTIMLAYRRCVGMTTLVRRYPDALQLVEGVSDKTAGGDSAAGKGRLGLKPLDSFLLLQSEKQDDLLFTDAVGVFTKTNMKEKRKAALFSLRTFYCCAAALLEEFKTVHKKTFPATRMDISDVYVHLGGTHEDVLAVCEGRVCDFYDPIFPRLLKKKMNISRSRERPL